MTKLDPEFAMNPDPRCACVLLLDTSGSMSGSPIDALNEGLRVLQQDLQEDALARRRVEIAVVTFGGRVTEVQDFVTAGEFIAPTLQAGGETPMGEAMGFALDLVRKRKEKYRSSGVPYYQPWVFMITDGAPTDGDLWKTSAQRVKTDMDAKALAFFAVGVSGADMQVLAQITPRAILLDGLKFQELFVWLSQSQRKVSGSKVGEQTPLPQVGFASPV